MQAVTFSAYRFERPADRLWAFAQMGAARRPLHRELDGGFGRLLGSGAGEGFSPRPNFGVYAILAVWPSLERARERLAEAALFRRYRARASEHWTVYLRALSSRGAWSGRAPFSTYPTEPQRPIAALTRATLKPTALRAFWRREPAISAALAIRPDGLLFQLGVGELPWLQQATFTLWRDAESMAAFAASAGPHAEAARDAYRLGWFRECLFARFVVLECEGAWNGRDPLASIKEREPA